MITQHFNGFIGSHLGVCEESGVVQCVSYTDMQCYLKHAVIRRATLCHGPMVAYQPILTSSEFTVLHE